jgi:large subunit ribosomal protein L18
MERKSYLKNLRFARRKRIRRKIFGTPLRPRLTVYKSNKHIYAQIIDDEKGQTVVAASSLSKEFKEQNKTGSNIEGAKIVGDLMASKALEKNIERIVFDRNGFLYQGRVKALAEALRDKGISF